MRGSALGWEAFVDGGVEGGDADFVFHPVADVADEDRGVYRVVEPGDLFDARGHAMSSVEAEEDFLAALHAELADDDAAVSGRRAPGDVAVVVVDVVVAEAIEVAAFADARGGAGAEGAEGVVIESLVPEADGVEVGEDVHDRRLAGGNDALDEAAHREGDGEGLGRA